MTKGNPEIVRKDVKEEIANNEKTAEYIADCDAYIGSDEKRERKSN